MVSMTVVNYSGNTLRTLHCYVPQVHQGEAGINYLLDFWDNSISSICQYSLMAFWRRYMVQYLKGIYTPLTSQNQSDGWMNPLLGSPLSYLGEYLRNYYQYLLNSITHSIPGTFLRYSRDYWWLNQYQLIIQIHFWSYGCMRQPEYSVIDSLVLRIDIGSIRLWLNYWLDISQSIRMIYPVPYYSQIYSN